MEEIVADEASLAAALERSDGGATETWAALCDACGLLDWPAGVAYAHAEQRTHGDDALLEALRARPLKRYRNLPAPLLTRLRERVLLALRHPKSHVAAFVEDVGARRDYLALASDALLRKHVTLVDAGPLVAILSAVWRRTQSRDELDAIGDLMAAHLRPLSLLRSVLSQARWQAFAGLLSGPSWRQLRPGLAALVILCDERAARTHMLASVARQGFVGCAASLLASAWVGPAPVPQSTRAASALRVMSPSFSRADVHRHAALGRSGTHYLHGELIDAEEDAKCEFKAVQLTQNVPTQILRYAPSYVVAFLNAGGGRILFGVEDNGRVAGVRLNRAERDTLRLGIDCIGVQPDASHLLQLLFSPVVGADDERFVVELRVGPGGNTIYATRLGEHWYRRKGGIALLKGEVLWRFVERKLAGSGACERCVAHPGELQDLLCRTCGGVPVCPRCLLQGRHAGHAFDTLDDDDDDDDDDDGELDAPEPEPGPISVTDADTQ